MEIRGTAELEKLKKALDKLLDTGKGGNNKWENIFKTFEKGFAELKGAKGAKEVSGAIGTISGAASEAAGELANMFDQMGNTEVADALNGMQQVMGAVSNIGQGFAKGGLIGGIGAAIGEAANFLTSAFAAEARHKEALKEIEKAKLDFQRQYNLLLLEQNLLLEKAENIFGERQVAKAANAIEVYRDALSQFKEELAGDAPTMNRIERMTGDFAGTYRKRVVTSKLRSPEIIKIRIGRIMPDQHPPERGRDHFQPVGKGYNRAETNRQGGKRRSPVIRRQVIRV